MKKSINIYWAILEKKDASLPLLSSRPESVIFDYVKNNKSNKYVQCPAFAREYNNTFMYRALRDFVIDINPDTILPTNETTCDLLIRDPKSKTIAIDSSIIFFSDESIEMSQIPSSLHITNFVDSTNLFSGRYDIGKWFRPLNMEFILKKPHIKVKKDDVLFYIKFHTDKKINFINFRYNEEILKIEDACLSLKLAQPGYRFKDIYNFFTRIGYHKKLLKEIKKNLTDLK